MTKEELEKEAEKWLRKYLLCYNCEKKCNCIESNSYCEEQVLKAYVDSAELREKQIQIDAEQIRALQKQNGELTDKARELEKELEYANTHCLFSSDCPTQKENAELKSRECWKSCEYANPKSELIALHIKDIQNLTKAKKIISEWEDSFCCGADYLYLGNKGKELRIKSQKFLNSEVEK